MDKQSSQVITLRQRASTRKRAKVIFIRDCNFYIINELCKALKKLAYQEENSPDSTRRSRDENNFRFQFAPIILWQLGSEVVTLSGTMEHQIWDDHRYPLMRHCDKGTPLPVAGTMTGSIPAWLQGDLVRIGPGIQRIGVYQYKHVFDGLAVLHKFTIKEGNVTYQSRVLQSDTYKKNVAANRIVVSEFGTRAYPDPCQSIFGRMQTEFKSWLALLNKPEMDEKITDNCSVNTTYYGDQFHALGESAFQHQIDPGTLNTCAKKINVNDHIPVSTTTAHPHVLEDGTVINVGNNYKHKRGPHYSFIKIPPSYNSKESAFKNARLIAEIPSRWTLHSAYFHSFGVTTSGKIIFVEYPLKTNLFGVVMGPILGLGINWGQSYSDYITWSPSEKTRFYVITMDTGKVSRVTYETDKLFSFHHINAYEEDDELIVDLIGYNGAEWLDNYNVKNYTKPDNYLGTSSARRYVLPLNVDSAQPGENLVKIGGGIAKAILRPGKKKVVDVSPHYWGNYTIELPRINYRYNGRRYRYFYGLEQGSAPHSFDLGMKIISKVDLFTGEKIQWLGNKDCRVSEAVFVPDCTKGPAAAEDEGVLLAMLLENEKPTAVSLLLLNATNLREIGRVAFMAWGTVTDTFHGQWAQKGDRVSAY